MSKDEAKKAIGAGNWKSRTLMVGAATIVLVVGVATTCMFVAVPGAEAPVATFAQWASFTSITVPSIFASMLAALGWEKHKLAKLLAGGEAQKQPAQ